MKADKLIKLRRMLHVLVPLGSLFPNVDDIMMNMQEIILFYRYKYMLYSNGFVRSLLYNNKLI